MRWTPIAIDRYANDLTILTSIRMLNPLLHTYIVIHYRSKHVSTPNFSTMSYFYDTPDQSC